MTQFLNIYLEQKSSASRALAVEAEDYTLKVNSNYSLKATFIIQSHS